MNIWVDICHTPQLNLFKNLIIELSKRGHRVYVTVMDRGKLPKIVSYELSNLKNVSVDVVGHHRMTKLSVIFEANLLRVCQLFFWTIGKDINMVFSSAMLTSMVARLFNFPSYCFGDDPQTKMYPLYVKIATQAHVCIYEATENMILRKRDKIIPSLKEWTYLSPKYFISNISALKKYGVKPKEYIFLREVSVGTMNYSAQIAGAIVNIKDSIPKNKKVLLSLEEKHRRNEYPEDWFLLQEPINDIHSLIYYSAGLVSSGDSMAREAALLGVPSYYLGVRHSMPANAAAHKVAGLQNELSMPFEEWVKTLDVDVDEAVAKQEKLRKHIDEEFIDINEYMLSLVDEVAKKKQKK